MRSARARSGVAVTAATLLGAGALSTLTVAPASPAFAAPPTVCTATGGTITTDTLIDGIRWNVHVFNSNATFTPAQNTAVQYLVVGGGGGGGGARGTSGSSRGYGGGGGSGAVVSGTGLAISSAQNVTRGAGGAGGTNTGTGGTGSTSSIGALVTAAGGGGGGSPGLTSGLAGNGAAGASGGGGSGEDIAHTGGSATAGNAGGVGNPSATYNQRAGGGGGGPAAAGGNAGAATGGAGGGGTASTITGTSITYGGGGGGGGATAGAGGGAGRAGTTNGNVTAATANRGGGGGGAGASTTTSRNGGAGGTGVVVIRYPRYCLTPSPPTSAALSGGGSFTWAAPVYVPASQTVTSYTVVYTGNGQTSWGIYARGSATASMDVSAMTIAACGTANPGRTCLLANGDLVSGQTYQFRVFARTASSIGQMTASFPYTAP